jgi:hypothetical protein
MTSDPLSFRRRTVAYGSFSFDAPAWRDHTSDFISFGVRLALKPFGFCYIMIESLRTTKFGHYQAYQSV